MSRRREHSESLASELNDVALANGDVDVRGLAFGGYDGPTAVPLFEEPCRRYVIGMNVGFEREAQREAKLVDERGVARELLEHAIDENGFAGRLVRKEIRERGRTRIEQLAKNRRGGAHGQAIVERSPRRSKGPWTGVDASYRRRPEVC